MTERELIQQQQELGDKPFPRDPVGQVFLRLRLRGFRLGTRHRLPCHAPAA